MQTTYVKKILSNYIINQPRVDVGKTMRYLYSLSTLVKKIENWWCPRFTVKLHIVADALLRKKISNNFTVYQLTQHARLFQEVV